jgi:hypothetical protein
MKDQHKACILGLGFRSVWGWGYGLSLGFMARVSVEYYGLGLGLGLGLALSLLFHPADPSCLAIALCCLY